MIDPNQFVPQDPAENSRGYRYSQDLRRAIRVALATERPLLLQGVPGTGKSRMAEALAAELGAEFYTEVVTSATEARDLEWSFDALQRLCDAQAGAALNDKVANLANYVRPRALWWAFDPASALELGETRPPQRPEARVDRAVVLIDEIDKAEPQVANDLLEPFDGRGFTVAETRKSVPQKRDVVLVVTTNAERDLPAAFLRRCVVFRLPLPDAKMLEKLGRVHFAKTQANDDTLEKVAALTVELQVAAETKNLRAPAVAEFLDAVRAVSKLKPTDDEWDRVARLALWKHGDEGREGA